MKLNDLADVRSPVDVRPLAGTDSAAWESFIANAPEATFFHQLGWKTILEDVFRHRTHYLVAQRAGAVVGALPLAEVKSVFFGHTLTSLPFAVYGGAVAVDADARDALHSAAVGLAQELGVEHLELRNVQRTEPQWPLQDLYVTYRKPLAPDPEANMLAIPRKQRAMVRKAIGRGLTAEIDSNVETFFRLYADNVHRHGTPGHSRRYFEALMTVFGPACEVLTVRDQKGLPVSSVLSFYWRDEVLPYYAGDVPAARDLAANDFKYWALMERACKRGLRIFDYGRSKRGTGSYDFKKNWGFEATPLAYEYRLFKRDAIPQNNPMNPKYRAFIALWRRLPRVVVNAAGPAIVRNLG